MRISFKFELRDAWVGVSWGNVMTSVDNGPFEATFAIHVGFLPCCQVRFSWPVEKPNFVKNV